MDTNSRDTHQNVGQIIADERLRRSMSQVELAERVGMSQEWVTKVETGRIKRPKLHNLRQVSEVLGLDFSTLVIAAGYASDPGGASKVGAAVPVSDPLDDPLMRVSFSRLPELTDENLEKVRTLIEDLYRLQELGQLQNTKAGARRKRGS